MYFSPWALPKDCYSIKANCKALKAQVPSDIRPEIIVPISKTNKAHQSSENEWRGWIWINPWDQGEHSTNKVHTRKMSPIGNTEQNPKTYFLHCWVSAVLKQRTVRVLGIVYIIHGLACPCSSLPEKLSFTSEEWTLCDYIYICGETLWQGLCVYLCVCVCRGNSHFIHIRPTRWLHWGNPGPKTCSYPWEPLSIPAILLFRTVVTKSQRPGGLNHRLICLTVLEAQDQAVYSARSFWGLLAH